jgi:hypothetical protein
MLKAQLAEATAAGKVQTAPAVGASADRLKEPTKTVQRQGVDSHFFTPILKEGINEKEPRKNIAEDTLKSGLTKPQVIAIFFFQKQRCINSSVLNGQLSGELF